MEGDTFSGLGNGTQIDGKILQTFQKSFVQVQNILDQNRVLINEINQNHESRVPDNLSRNVGLIRELNNNIRRVVDLYADLSSSFTKSMEVSSEGDSSGAVKSDGKAGHKRHRPAQGVSFSFFPFSPLSFFLFLFFFLGGVMLMHDITIVLRGRKKKRFCSRSSSLVLQNFLQFITQCNYVSNKKYIYDFPEFLIL